MKQYRHRLQGNGLTATSVRIPRELLEQFQGEARKLGKSMNQVICDWMEHWTASEDQLPFSEKSRLTAIGEKQLAGIIASEVADSVGRLLKSDPSWAQQVIRTAHLNWPGGILQERMAHYSQEKSYLAKRFSDWLGRRVEYLLKRGSDVHLLVDAGSTNLWLVHHLWEHLARLSDLQTNRGIFIITNNIPVAESFAEQCLNSRFQTNTPIRCELLGGELQPRYGAVTGSVTSAQLLERTDHMPKPGTYIALMVGNLIRLNRHPVNPVPLVRGAGFKNIKEFYLSRAHEIYVIAPLGKIFLASTAETNKLLGFSASALEHSRQAYDEVNVTHGKTQFIKLVTTLRHSVTSILLRHSAAVQSWLGYSEETVPDPTADIQAIPHICLPFDDHLKGRSFQEQVNIEFPHKHMRDPRILSHFGVRRLLERP